MLNSCAKPTLLTYSALICSSAKSVQRSKAEEMFHCMLRSGIKLDKLAYSIMLDVHLRSDSTKCTRLLYQEMLGDGFFPDLALCEALFPVLGREKNGKYILKVVKDLEVLRGLGPEKISFGLTRGMCYDYAATILRLAVIQGYGFDQDNLLLILGSYSLSGRITEAVELLNSIKDHASGSQQFI